MRLSAFGGWAAVIFIAGAASLWFPQGPRQPADGGTRNSRSGQVDRNAPPGSTSGQPQSRRGLLEQMSAFQLEVPTQAYNAILVQPTPTTVTVSIISADAVMGFIEFGEVTPTGAPARYSQRTPVHEAKAGVPVNVKLDHLKPDTAYSYRWRYKAAGSEADAFEVGLESFFHTVRTPGKAQGFRFTIQADSHLDANMSPAVYAQALANALADAPDFHIDLGDTFMVDKRAEFKDALPQYAAQRYYFGLLCRSAPLFMALGNHDGEYGYGGAGADQISGWSYAQRVRSFPPPVIGDAGGMYSGRTSFDQRGGANYYAFDWGDATFVVLDRFWQTQQRIRGNRGRGGGGASGGVNSANSDETDFTDQSWNFTLGREQYDWLDRTLAASKSPFKFVFIHHLVGGRGRSARGGVESAPYFEWGGRSADGSNGFASHRPDWPMPIHQLLAARHVSAVFHGHDHLYVRDELDGVIYQCVPQPGNALGGTRSAAEYGYSKGVILGSPGHLRVTVTPREASVAYIRAAVALPEPRRRGQTEANGAVVAEYTIKARE